MEYPQAAVNEAFRVLKPGGRFAFTLWFDGKNGNDLFKIVSDAHARFVTDSFVLPETWTQMRFANEHDCESVTGKLRFGAPLFKRLPIAWQITSAQQAVEILGKMSVRTKMILERQPPVIQRRICEYILVESRSPTDERRYFAGVACIVDRCSKTRLEKEKMMNLEPKYALFDSVDQMLTPETLSELLTKPVTRVDSRTINEHAGMAGGQLSYIDTDAGRFVLKRMFINSDWVMSTTNDRCCRAVKLWQYGLLDQLLPHLEHKIIACSQDGDGWAILMEDLTGHVFTWNTPLTTELVYLFLDRLARIHATFWNEPCLPEASLGLCTPTQLIEAISLSHAQTYNHLSMGLLPEWIRDGWEVMEAKLDLDVYTHMRNLSEHPQPLVKALKSLSLYFAPRGLSSGKSCAFRKSGRPGLARGSLFFDDH